MSLVAELISLFREKAIEKTIEHPIAALSTVVVLGFPVGGFAALGLLTGLHVLSYRFFDENRDRKEIAEKLEQLGYETPTIEHLLVGGLCLRGRHPYRWQSAQGSGTACVGAFLPVAVHKGWLPWEPPFPKAVKRPHATIH